MVDIANQFTTRVLILDVQQLCGEKEPSAAKLRGKRDKEEEDEEVG